MATTTACARIRRWPAVLNYEGTPEYTLAAVLTDKEEIGSVGANGHGRYVL